MTRVHKVTMYLVDHEELESDSINIHIKEALDRRLDIYPRITEVKSSEEFDWDDDIKINFAKATEEDYENIMKGKIEYDRT